MPLSIASPISEAEQRDALHRSGSACVRCGCTIVGFCRLDADPSAPPFALCPDCFTAIRAANIAPEVIRRLRDRPIAREPSFDRAQFLFAARRRVPDTLFPDGTRMAGTFCPVAFGGRPVLSFVPPDGDDQPLGIDVRLGTAEGRPEAIVQRNLWLPPSEGWNFARRGTRYVFDHPAGVRLAFRWPRPGEIVIEAIRCWSEGTALVIDREGATLGGKPVRLPAARDQLVGVYL